MKQLVYLFLLTGIITAVSCDKDNNDVQPRNPDTAEKAVVDRFSAAAGMLFVRNASNGLPAAGAAVNFDVVPGLITKGLGPTGEKVEYYNFDVQPDDPAPIYVLFRENETSPVAGQLNIINVIPGDAGYNDFWQVVKVTVPSGYVANTVTSLSEIQAAGYAMDEMPVLVNCPVVPEGSVAAKRFKNGDAGLTRGWYKNKVVFYFNFVEHPDFMVTGNGKVPAIPIYVTFNTNPPAGGPASGFVTEGANMQTHNVLAQVPEGNGYSPLWEVKVYDNADFSSVMDLTSAEMANLLVPSAALVNCPVVSVQ